MVGVFCSRVAIKFGALEVDPQLLCPGNKANDGPGNPSNLRVHGTASIRETNTQGNVPVSPSSE